MSGKFPPDSSRLIPATPLSSPLCYRYYTIMQAAKNAAGGIGLLEVYDLDSAGDAMLANISTRGLVQTADEVIIRGFILQGRAKNQPLSFVR